MTTELDWLRDAQPRPDHDTRSFEVATADARAALLEHVDAETAASPNLDAATAASPIVSFAPRRGRRRSRRASALVGIAAAAAIGGVVLGVGPGRGLEGVFHPTSAQAAPIVRLAARLADAPTPPGDATLVVHHNATADGQSFSGNDLMLDNGTYYYGSTRGDLKTAEPEHGDENGSVGAEVRAALAANSLPPAQARQQMVDATLAPVDPNAPKPDPADLAKQAAAKEAAAREAGRTNLNHPDPLRPAPQSVQDDNRVWSGTLDALELAGGRPDVRAGVLRLMTGIQGIKVAKATVDGHDVIRLQNTEFPRNYAETMTIDATSGLPLRFVGGTVGAAQPDVVVTYDVSRVTAADVVGDR